MQTTTAAACLLMLVLWTTQSTGSNLPVGSAQDFHVAFHQDHELAPHRPSNVLKLSPCGEAIEESILHSPAFGTLHVKLGPGASLRAEAGVMVCMQVGDKLRVLHAFASSKAHFGACRTSCRKRC